MPERLESEVYQPETTRLMKEAFDEAWPSVKTIDHDSALTRKLLASAIVDQINAGVRDRETIVARALATVTVARNLSS
jgi:hypothetical protein